MYFPFQTYLHFRPKEEGVHFWTFSAENFLHSIPERWNVNFEIIRKLINRLLYHLVVIYYVGKQSTYELPAVTVSPPLSSVL